MSIIKLAIDAKWYFEGPPSGKVVVKNLVNELIRIKDNSIDLYLIVQYKYRKEAEQLFKDRAVIIPVPSKPNLISNLFILPFALGKYKLDFVLFQNFVSIWPSTWKKIAYIHDVLFLDYPNYYSTMERLYYWPMGLLAKAADYVVTISNSEKDRIVAHGIARQDNTFVVYHGVNELYKPISKYSYDSIESIKKMYKLPDKFILYVGRINIRKNLLGLIKSLEFVDKSVKLVIVGKEEFKNDDIDRCIEELNLKHRVIFTGHVRQEDLYLIYALSKVFCFPSFAEGFGLPPLEAMRCGVPAIVADRTAMPEICGDAAEYIDPESPSDIGIKISKLITDDSYYAERSNKSIKHASQFNWETSARQISDLIKKLYGIRENHS